VPGLTALALDLGGSHVSCAVVRDGSLLTRKTLPAQAAGNLADLLVPIADCADGLMDAAGISWFDCAGIVLGFPGIVHAREKRVLATNAKFVDATELDLNGWFTRRFNVPFYIENDARLALLGEQAFGAARGADDAVMITLGTGIGGSAMLNGRLLESKHGLAGMIGGHLTVVLDGRVCSCGNRGCAESEAATAALDQVIDQVAGKDAGLLNDGRPRGFSELFEAVDRGNEAALAVLDHCLQVWSVLTVSLIHAYDPEVVVYGGSVLKRSRDILPRIQEYVNAHAWTPGRNVPLRVSIFGSDAALLGAIPLIESSR
jgi:glucokinase